LAEIIKSEYNLHNILANGVFDFIESKFNHHNKLLLPIKNSIMIMKTILKKIKVTGIFFGKTLGWV